MKIMILSKNAGRYGKNISVYTLCVVIDYPMMIVL